MNKYMENLVQYAEERGWKYTGDQRRHVQFEKGNKHAWSSFYGDEYHFRYAEVIDNHFTNHETYHDIEKLLDEKQ